MTVFVSFILFGLSLNLVCFTLILNVKLLILSVESGGLEERSRMAYFSDKTLEMISRCESGTVISADMVLSTSVSERNRQTFVSCVCVEKYLFTVSCSTLNCKCLKSG